MNKDSLLNSLFRYFGRSSFSVRKRWATGLGWLAARLLRSRVHIVRTNLALAFPELSDSERKTLLHRHFHLLAQSVVDRGLLWFGPASTVMNTTPIRGLEHIDDLLAKERRIILLAPHFIGLDAAATRLTLFLRESATMYTPQSDDSVDAMIRTGRSRFNTVHLVSRKDGIRDLLRFLRRGVPVYYLPDMDFGRSGATFVPFFGVPAATLLATAQIARTWDACIVPIISRLNEETGQYHIEVLPALEDFPGNQNNEEATARLNLLIEEWVRTDPAQYYWVHRRFKTRPNPDDPKLYKD